MIRPAKVFLFPAEDKFTPSLINFITLVIAHNLYICGSLPLIMEHQKIRKMQRLMIVLEVVLFTAIALFIALMLTL